MALGIGFALVALIGVGHHFALLGLRGLTADARDRPNRAMISVFIGLLAIHLVQILAFAAAYRILLTWEGMGQLHAADAGWGALIHFSGISYSTLGHTAIEATGPIRQVHMMQSLGGFMILTWSATFIYSVWKRAVEGSDRE